MKKTKSIPKNLPKAYFQFRALRAAWLKSSSSMKDTMVSMLTESMNEVVEIYNLENDAMKDLTDRKE